MPGSLPVLLGDHIRLFRRLVVEPRKQLVVLNHGRCIIRNDKPVARAPAHPGRWKSQGVLRVGLSWLSAHLDHCDAAALCGDSEVVAGLVQPRVPRVILIRKKNHVRRHACARCNQLSAAGERQVYDNNRPPMRRPLHNVQQSLRSYRFWIISANTQQRGCTSCVRVALNSGTL